MGRGGGGGLAGAHTRATRACRDDVDSSRRDDLDDCSVDEFVASAIASECPYELPSRMRLSDVIDILCDSWDLDDAL